MQPEQAAGNASLGRFSAHLAYGMYVNGLDKVGRSKGGKYATVVGSVLVIVAIGLKYWG